MTGNDIQGLYAFMKSVYELETKYEALEKLEEKLKESSTVVDALKSENEQLKATIESFGLALKGK